MLFLLDVRYLPREVDPLVYNMSSEDPGNINYTQIGGLGEQIRELREVRRQKSKYLKCLGTFFLTHFWYGLILLKP